MKACGQSLARFFDGRWTLGSVAADFVFAALGFVAANLAGEWLKVTLGGAPANTAFLLPRSLAERILWVAVSCTAGLCEETVYRGYLQQQLGRLAGYLPLGVILQAVAFGVSHGYQGYASMLTTGAYGLTLGVLVWWRGNLRSAALAHAATDIIGGLMSTPP
jgi:membrane protease YdiL (CAAX protease family)